MLWSWHEMLTWKPKSIVAQTSGYRIELLQQRHDMCVFINYDLRTTLVLERESHVFKYIVLGSTVELIMKLVVLSDVC